MSGNGQQIGLVRVTTGKVRAAILKVHSRVQSVFSGGGAGFTMPGAFVHHTAILQRLTTAAVTWASGLFSRMTRKGVNENISPADSCLCRRLPPFFCRGSCNSFRKQQQLHGLSSDVIYGRPAQGGVADAGEGARLSIAEGRGYCC